MKNLGVDTSGFAQVGDRFLEQVDNESESIIKLCSDLIRAPSENPPGDTTKAAEVVTAHLRTQGFDFQIYEPTPGKQNMVARFDTGCPGPHLVFNGHLDVFPAGDKSLWARPPFSGVVENGRIFGRGAVDMKAGSTALLYVFSLLPQFETGLCGRATLTLVCDEETFGEHGARYVLDHVPDVTGDALLSAEPGQVVGFGERGFVWSNVQFRTKGGHSAYPHLSQNAIKLAARFIHDVQALEKMPAKLSDEVKRHLVDVKTIQDRMLGRGSTEVAKQYSVNIGRIGGGTKINMNAADCDVEIDVRLPVSTQISPIVRILRQVARKHGAGLRIINTAAPSMSNRNHPIFQMLQRNAKRIIKTEPPFQLSLATSDARLWRYKGVPAAKFGPRRNNVGRPNEFVLASDLLDTVRVHGLTALEFLARGLKYGSQKPSGPTRNLRRKRY